MKMYKKIAKPISYDYSKKRKKKNVIGIVIHYTGNDGDTAKGNVDYFANQNNRTAGAHFFVDRQGNIGRSIPMNRTAWAVGGFYDDSDGAGRYYNKLTNYNTVSIELCDVASRKPSKKQVKATKKLIKYIKKYCKNVNTIVRHWDVNGKSCPIRMIGKNNTEWKQFKSEVG